MGRWMMMVAIPVVLCGSLFQVEARLARIKKVDQDQVTFRYSSKTAKEMTLPVAKDAVIAKAVLTLDKRDGRRLYEAGEPIKDGLRDLVFQKIEDELGLSAAITTNERETEIVQILVHPSVYRKK